MSTATFEGGGKKIRKKREKFSCEYNKTIVLFLKIGFNSCILICMQINVALSSDFCAGFIQTIHINQARAH